MVDHTIVLNSLVNKKERIIMSHYTVFLPDEAATLSLGAQWASLVSPPLIIYLAGDLGAGKTTLTRGLLRALGYQGVVKSPTYALLESYSLTHCDVHHFDLYRFNHPQEWQDAGLDDVLDDRSIALIEWANQAKDYAPAADIHMDLSVQEHGRMCSISALSEQGRRHLDLWKNQF
jgi:tRNA threonylcarbamoyladenosine biosynthesis protein TsaE